MGSSFGYDPEIVAEWHRRATEDAAGASAFARSLDDALKTQLWRGPQSPIPIRPVILDQETAGRVAHAAKNVVQLAVAECERRARDPYQLCDLLGVEPSPLLCGRPSWNQWAASQARPDLVLSGGVPKVLECNIASAFGGPEHLHRMNARFWGDPRYRELAKKTRTWSGNSVSARRELVARIAGQRTDGVPQIAVAGSNEQHFVEVIDDAASNGLPCVFVELDELYEDGGLRNQHGLGIDVLLMKFVMEGAYADGEPMGALEAAVEHDSTLLLAPALSHLYSNKKVLAWLTERAPALPAHHRDFIEDHVPWTSVLEDRKVLRGGRERDLLGMLESHKEEFIVKPAGGLGGAGVVIGHETTDTEWRELLTDRLTGEYVVQEYCRPDTLPMSFVDEASGECLSLDLPHVLSPILIEGRAGGIFARFSAPGGPGVTSTAAGGLNTVFVHA
ncbi:hypothetical protein [Nocardiopsis synnemataformans]|uniref:hypothetical protein n=1 Tax=Nocardiopsis synnemataformans TaxID=61305 RepID=UPI003EBAE475